MIDDHDMDASEFSDLMIRMAVYAENTIEAVIRKTVIDFYRRIVERTPVDLGRAKASWGITGYRLTDHELPYDEDGYTVNEITAVINEQVSEFRTEILDDQVIIYNNLEYIESLEKGSSDQAPAGMVAVSIAEFESFFNQAIQELAGDII